MIISITGKITTLDLDYNTLILEITPDQMLNLQIYLNSLLLAIDGYSPLLPDYNCIKVSKVIPFSFSFDSQIKLKLKISPWIYTNREAEFTNRGLSLRFVSALEIE